MIKLDQERIRELKENTTTYIRTLFDFSFTTYLTIQLLPFFYGLIITACGTVVAYAILEAFTFSIWRGVFYVLISPFAFLVMLSVARALFEFFIVIFRIAENVDELVQLRDSVERLSGLTDMTSLTKRIPFWGLFTAGARRPTSRYPGKTDPNKS